MCISLPLRKRAKAISQQEFTHDRRMGKRLCLCPSQGAIIDAHASFASFDWVSERSSRAPNWHLRQLSSGAPTSLDASAIHLEMVNAVSRILSHTCSTARAVQGDLQHAL
jgi:hypothetical protein